MKKRTQGILAAACVLSVAATTAFTTVAYLTSKDKVTNTFTVGKVAISLDEVKVTPDGIPQGDARVKANTYKLVPGCTYTKDPTIHVAEGSETCWLFAKIQNGIAGDEAGENTIAQQLKIKGWTPVSEGSSVYEYKDKVNGGDDIVLFEQFTIEKTSDLSGVDNASIMVTGYAVQAEGFESAAAAIAAAPFPED